MTVNAAFVLEQTLGHVTHGRNLRETSRAQSSVRPTWIPIEFTHELPLRLIPSVGQNWSMQASWKARRALTNALRSDRPDALFFHSQVTSLFSVDLMRRIPSVISLDATPINFDGVGEHYGHTCSGGLLERAKFRLNQRAFHAARALVTWSEWAKRSLVSDYGVRADRVRVITPGANQAFFEIGRRRLTQLDTATQETRNEQEPVRLLFVGGDFRRKGGPLLLECMRGPVGERCELHLVTSEPMQSSPGVIVHNGLGPNSPELLGLFEQADLLVLPSMAECLAVVLMEASAAALPVIATDVGALGEAVQHAENGMLIRAGDIRSLQRAIAALVDDASLRQRMSRGAYHLAARRFDAQANGIKIFDLVAALAAHDLNTRRAA